MKRTILTVVAVLVLACAGEQTKECEVQPVVQPRGAPRHFLFCGDAATAECWTEPRDSGFRWGEFYCSDVRPRR